MLKRIVSFIIVLILSLSFASCGTIAVAPQDSQPVAESQEVSSPTIPEITVVSPTTVQTPMPEPTPTLEPVPTPEIPDSASSGNVIFDIYQHKASRDINMDGINEEIEFTAGEAESTLIINGFTFIIHQEGLAQIFAITDVDKDDDILELVFTDEYDPALPEGEFAFSWLYWWNGSEIIKMGGLMDVKFAGAWRSEFVATNHFDAEGIVTCLTDTDEFTYLYYMGHYTPRDEGDDRTLYEKLYATTPVGEPKKIKCLKPCLLLEEITKDYYNSAYDFYWIPTLWPYTAGRVPHVDDGIVIIAQTGEYLTIVKVYGKLWFKLKTSDGYSGWIRCENGGVDAYEFVMGWDADDMFSGL